MPRILKTFSDKEDLVRSVVGEISSNSKEITVFEGTVSKLALLVENEHN